MQENNFLFSREAMDKLRSPDRLDKMVAIITPLDWMLLAAGLLFIAAILLWSIFGAFTVTVSGMGLIMDAAGTVDVSHTSSGQITRLYASPGTHVSKGDVLAKMVQIEKDVDANLAREGLSLASSEREARGYVYQYDQKRQNQLVTETVYSEYDGIVDDVMVSEGMVVGGGTPLCRIRLTKGTDELRGILYIPVENGKRVKPGMIVQIAPNGVDVTESGSLIGIVRSVSQYPLSMQGAQHDIGNAYLAQWIAEKEKSALMEVRFDLARTSAEAPDPSGKAYLWTSEVGDRPEITPGSFCKGSVVVERKPPIEKVFYKISQWLRSR